MFKNAKICHFLNSMELFDNAVRGIDDDFNLVPKAKGVQIPGSYALGDELL